MKKIGILGSGMVAKALAVGFIKHGFSVMMGTREPGKINDWAAAHPGLLVRSFSETAKYGDALVLAVKGTAASTVLALAGGAHLAGKTIMDTTNPIADAPPVNHVLSFFTVAGESLMEKLQSEYPEAKFVKVFNSVGNPLMVNPDFDGIKPTMFICGNDAGAKQEVKEVLDLFGWETEDLGSDRSAECIESLCILWCIPGFMHNTWMHAFKLLKK
ncbi:MAG TPA: NAD(P)-binding domain-containing protein [Bacteroidia bacterium]|nr:NAD(P)-binding domain-containing protein [Bacteroidia bacterium]